MNRVMLALYLLSIAASIFALCANSECRDVINRSHGRIEQSMLVAREKDRPRDDVVHLELQLASIDHQLDVANKGRRYIMMEMAIIALGMALLYKREWRKKKIAGDGAGNPPTAT